MVRDTKQGDERSFHTRTTGRNAPHRTARRANLGDEEQPPPLDGDGPAHVDDVDDETSDDETSDDETCDDGNGKHTTVFNGTESHNDTSEFLAEPEESAVAIVQSDETTSDDSVPGDIGHDGGAIMALALLNFPEQKVRGDAALASVPTTPSSSEDEQNRWVALASNGDQRAFARLFDANYSRVYAMCSRMLYDASDVEDAVQQTFLEAWRSLPRFEGRSRFSTWLTRIAIHTCFSVRRRVRRFLSHVPLDAAGAIDLPIPTFEHPDESLEFRRQKSAVSEMLQKIAPKKRVVFALAELEGMTAPEIAEILQIPEATVRTRLFHARRDFEKRLAQHRAFAGVTVAGGGDE